jgi:hypothetical protein
MKVKLFSNTRYYSKPFGDFKAKNSEIFKVTINRDILNTIKLISTQSNTPFGHTFMFTNKEFRDQVKSGSIKILTKE